MRPSPRLIEARFFIFLLVKENMKDLFSFNLVTLLNCGKIRYLNKDSADPCHFYDVSFFDLKDLQIENVIKAVGLYPLPFFSVKLADRKTHIRKVEAIRNTWFGFHIADFIHNTNHLLTYGSKIKEPHDLHEKLCLKDQHWSLLHAEAGDRISVVQHAFMRIGGDRILNQFPPPQRKSNPSTGRWAFKKQTSPLNRLSLIADAR